MLSLFVVYVCSSLRWVIRCGPEYVGCGGFLKASIILKIWLFEKTRISSKLAPAAETLGECGGARVWRARVEKNFPV